MNFLKSTVAVLLVGLFVVPITVAQAETVVRTGETVSIDKDQKIEGDFYTMANIVSISGEVSQDLVGLGGEMTLNGPVTQDALLAGGNVDVHGAIGDDLRVMAGNVVIAEPVTGDVFVIGGKVSILSTASIGGDLLVYGGDVEISGSVGGDIVGEVESLRIDAPVVGNVDVTTASLVIGDRADITGTVRYVSAEMLTRAPNAKIAGEITRNDPVVKAAPFNARMILFPVLILLFSSLVWYMLARPFLTKVVNHAIVPSVRTGVTGALVFFIAPVIILILTVSVLGTLVGIAAFFAYVLAILLTTISVSVVFGQFIMEQVSKKNAETLTPLTLGVGVIAVALCAIVPFIGPVVLLGVGIITLGALVDVLIRPTAA